MMGEAADDGNSDDAQTLAWSRPERSEPVRRTGLGGRDWSAMLKRARKVVQNQEIPRAGMGTETPRRLR